MHYSFEMTDESHKSRGAYQARNAIWFIAIIAVAALAGMIVVWRAPGIDRYVRDRLMQARGAQPPPDEIVIVAIDEASIAQLGRFPWPRALMARMLDRLAVGRPKAIALDVLYSEPTSPEDDRALAESIARAGNVVLAAQLIEAPEAGARRVTWLRPLPDLERAAAAVGHVNVLTESDGAARELPLRELDDQAVTFRAMALQVVRVGDGVVESSVHELPKGIGFGERMIPTQARRSAKSFAPRDAQSQADTVSPDRMAIDFIGPTGSFAPRTVSFADVLAGRVSPEVFRGKLTLIGATAATLGEQIASPFVHQESADGRQHGVLMPGVEVLANAVTTILRARYYRETPDWLATLCAAVAAAATLFLLAMAQGRFEAAKQLLALAGLIVAILILSWAAFVWWLIVPSLVPALISVATAAPLGLLRRSLTTSAELDARIAEYGQAEDRLTPSLNQAALSGEFPFAPAALIAGIAEADAAAIFVRVDGAANHYRLAAAHGAPVAASLAGSGGDRGTLPLSLPSSVIEAMRAGSAGNDSSQYFSFAAGHRADALRRALALPLGSAGDPSGALVIAYPFEREPEPRRVQLCVEISASYVAALSLAVREADNDYSRAHLAGKLRRIWPRGVEWKARMLGALNRRLLARALFVDRALRSVEDGLIVADVTGRIAFANPRAAAMFGLRERALIGSDLFQRLREAEPGAIRVDEAETRRANSERLETLTQLLVERQPREREITLGKAPARHYTLRLSAVCEGENGGGAALGIVASLADITRQRDLQQMKNDVMALVTHELRTPLTAIQGISELLAEYDVDDEQRRSLNRTINAEAKRLVHLVNDYLDLARLEADALPLRLTPVRAATMVERALVLLDPIAAQRGIRLVRRLAPNLPALMADADLVARAVNNLIANAIKFSPEKSEVIIEARADADFVLIEVVDRGPGIPSESRERIFEKFYRVPRLADADAPGTGLGLAFVREVAERHGGSVSVESETGVGSTFVLRLPVNSQAE
ncbi:MAG: CHASE2 domain-containing protein [Blastocatellales bacterium]